MDASHAFRLVGAVTGKTVVGKDGANLAVKNDGRRRALADNGRKRQEDASKTGETQIEYSSFSEYIVNQ
jgi:hypothetical protein